MRICVLTHPPLAGELRPRVFHLGGRRLPVVAILDRWRESTCFYFEVYVEDGRRFVLRHTPESFCWELAAVYAASKPRCARPVRLDLDGNVHASARSPATSSSS